MKKNNFKKSIMELVKKTSELEENFIIEQMRDYMDSSNPSELKWTSNVRLKMLKIREARLIEKQKTLDLFSKKLKDDDTKELAVFLHNIYEDFSKKENWKTQEKCRVKFDDLPEENKKVMLKVSAFLNRRNHTKIDKIKQELENE